MKSIGNDRKTISRTRSAAVLALSLTALIGVSVTSSAAQQASEAQPRKQQAGVVKPFKPRAAPAVAQPVQPRFIAPKSLNAAQNALEARIRSIGQSFNGDIGIAVQDVQTGWTTHYDGNTYFPQQSVSKFWVALTALDRADRGHLNLEAPVTVTRSDLTLFHQPIAKQIGANGYNTTLNSLMYRAITQSDNTCNDFVLWKAGGPDAVRSYLADKRISGVRFGPGERMLQARIAGMEWKPSMVGSGFYAARSALPMSVRRAAFEKYIRDPMDGATPLGIVDALARLQNGELLSPASTQKLLSTMSETRTGARRLKGGLARGWKLAHKTGTGQVLSGTQAGYNDIGIITGPDGRSYAIAVMIRRTAAPLGERMRAMQNTVRAVIDYSKALPPQTFVKKVAPQPATEPTPALQSVAATVGALAVEGEGE